ncbi:unnamed protein product, partial [Nesidiocoris tenuis]
MSPHTHAESNTEFSRGPAGNKRVPLWNATNTDRLKKDLLTGYDKFARPTNHSNVTPVDFTFEVTHIHI